MIVGDVELPGGHVAKWQQGAGIDVLLDDEWDLTAAVLGALGHPVRLRLLGQVLRGATTVREPAAIDGIGTTGQVYHHLRQLDRCGLAAQSGHALRGAAEAVVPLLTTILGGRR